MKRVFFIINPAANNGKAVRVWEQVADHLAKAGIPYGFAYSRDEEDLARIARQAAAEYQIVAGVGGDGTLSRIAGALVGTQACLGIIPAGTGNDFARVYAIPTDPAAACRIVCEGKQVSLDLGLCNGRFFYNIVGTGLDAEVAADANRIFKKISGSLSYLLALLRQLAVYRPRRVKLTVDGESREEKVWLVAVANGRYYGSGMKVAPDADPQDGLADIVIVGNIHRMLFLRLFPLVYKGLHIDHGAVRVLRGRTVRIEGDSPLPFHVDGDLAGTLPLHVTMIPAAVSVIVPAAE